MVSIKFLSTLLKFSIPKIKTIMVIDKLIKITSKFITPLDKKISPDQYLKELCIKGLQGRYKQTNETIMNRLNHELSIIKKMGYAGYFLITQDFVNYAKNNGIPVGPGRGSAAGSLDLYLIEVTNIDPVKYDLYFERFVS